MFVIDLGQAGQRLLGAAADRRDAEVAVELGQLTDDAVRREDDQPLAGGVGEDDHHLLRLRRPVLGRKGEGGLVPVVPVGDDQRRVGERRLRLRDRVGLGDAPDLRGGASVGRVEERVALGQRRQRLPGSLCRIVVEQEDRREVRAHGAQQLEL